MSDGFKPTRTRGESLKQIRSFEQEIIEPRYQSVMVHGVDLPSRDPGEVSVNTRVRTTDDWSVQFGVPILRGVVKKMAYRRGRCEVLLSPSGPSLIPAAGMWVDVECVEVDDA